MSSLGIQQTARLISEFFRFDATRKLKSASRSRLGQYMTLAPICGFMASMFDNLDGSLRVLDPEAGVGSLTASFVDRIRVLNEQPNDVSLVAYEINIFNNRNSTFSDDNVLKENVIIHAVRSSASTDVRILSSDNRQFFFDPRSGCWIIEDMAERKVPHTAVVYPKDPEHVVHIEPTGLDQAVVNQITNFLVSLTETGVEVSTGPIVDSRLKSELRSTLEAETVLLLYPTHFKGGDFDWPKQTKKSNAINVNEKSRRWLWPNGGHFEAASLLRSFGTDSWEANVDRYTDQRKSLPETWRQERQIRMIPSQLESGTSINLTSGDHSKLFEQVITQFAPRFVPDAEVVYVGDTDDKTALFSSKVLEELNVAVNLHGKLPDIVLYYCKENWLLLVEAVTNHGSTNPKRHSELAGIFRTSTAEIVYVTAFLSRLLMAGFLKDIYWETKVWCTDTPSHLIHFDGHSSLGPFQD